MVDALLFSVAFSFNFSCPKNLIKNVLLGLLGDAAGTGFFPRVELF